MRTNDSGTRPWTAIAAGGVLFVALLVALSGRDRAFGGETARTSSDSSPAASSVSENSGSGFERTAASGGDRSAIESSSSRVDLDAPAHLDGGVADSTQIAFVIDPRSTERVRHEETQERRRLARDQIIAETGISPEGIVVDRERAAAQPTSTYDP